MLGSLLTLLGGRAHVHTVLGHPAPMPVGTGTEMRVLLNAVQTTIGEMPGVGQHTRLADIARYQSDLVTVCGWKDRLSVDCRIPVSQTQCFVASRAHLSFIKVSTVNWGLAGTCFRDLHYLSLPLTAFSHEPEVKTRT